MNQRPKVDSTEVLAIKAVILYASMLALPYGCKLITGYSGLSSPTGLDSPLVSSPHIRPSLLSALYNIIDNKNFVVNGTQTLFSFHSMVLPIAIFLARCIIQFDLDTDVAIRLSNYLAMAVSTGIVGISTSASLSSSIVPIFSSLWSTFLSSSVPIVMYSSIISLILSAATIVWFEIFPEDRSNMGGKGMLCFLGIGCFQGLAWLTSAAITGWNIFKWFMAK